MRMIQIGGELVNFFTGGGEVKPQGFGTTRVGVGSVVFVVLVELVELPSNDSSPFTNITGPCGVRNSPSNPNDKRIRGRCFMIRLGTSLRNRAC